MENTYYGDIHQALYNIIRDFDADKAGDSIYNIFNSALDAFDEDDGATEVTAGITPDGTPTEKTVEQSWVHIHPDQVETVKKMEAAFRRSVEGNNSDDDSYISVIHCIAKNNGTSVREFYLNDYWMKRFTADKTSGVLDSIKAFVNVYIPSGISSELVFVIPYTWESHFRMKDGCYIAECMDVITKYIGTLTERPVNIRVQETPEQRYHRNVGRYRHLVEDMKHTIDEDLYEFMLYLVEQDEKRRQKV